MRALIMRCAVDYSGRLAAHLDPATRLVLVKTDGSVLIHSDGGSYKPLNWMTPPCRLTEHEPEQDEQQTGVTKVWEVRHNKTDDRLRIQIFEIIDEFNHELGQDPGLVKDGVESHLQALLAEHVEVLGDGLSLVRREYPTAVGPVDLLLRRQGGGTVAVEVKRRGEIDGVEQLSRYVDLLDRDPHLSPVTGVLAAQEIKPQARTLADDRGHRCVVLDYDALRGLDNPDDRLF